MQSAFIYPGSFCPPTYGHLRIIERAAVLFPEVIIFCSTNDSKTDQWFSEDESAALWNAYDLPKNARVITRSEALTAGMNFEDVVMIRGIRDEADMDHEKEVMMRNKKEVGIDKVFYLFAEESVIDISSSRARKAAEDFDLEVLAHCVAPKVVTALLLRAHKLERLALVVGPPGAGKSTFLQMVAANQEGCVHINTDEISQKTKPLLYNVFGRDANLIDLMRTHKKKCLAIIKEAWMKELQTRLLALPENAYAFIEVPYGLCADQNMFRYLGGDILYIGCEDMSVYKERLAARGTPQHKEFLKVIPDKEVSGVIAATHNLVFHAIDTHCTLEELGGKASAFVKSHKEVVQ